MIIFTLKFSFYLNMLELNTVFSIIVLTVISVFFWKRRNLYLFTNGMPGPHSLPLIGSGHLFFNKTDEQICDLIQKWLKEYPSPAKIWLGPMLALLIDDPNDLQIVLNSPSCLEKAKPYTFFGYSMGLFSSEVSTWKVHRKLLSNCFSFSVLKDFIPIMNEKAQTFVDILQPKIGHNEFDMLWYTSAFTLDTAMRTNFQLEINIQKDSLGARCLESIEELAEIIHKRLFSVFYYPKFVYNLSSLSKNEMIYRSYLDAAAQEILKNINSKNDQKAFQNEGRPLIQKLAMLHNDFQEAFPTDVVKDEIITVLVGGTETTGKTLAFVILMLAIYPEIQEKVYREIRSLDNGFGNSPGYEILCKLYYMETVIKETMRHFPVALVLGRQASDDVKLTRFIIPKGSQLIISPFSVHRNPKYWGSDCLKFDPENFLPERVLKRHTYSYIPFSGGSRNCIGIKYAMLSMKILLWNFLKKYRVKTSLNWNDLKLVSNITIKLANKHMVSIEPR